MTFFFKFFKFELFKFQIQCEYKKVKTARHSIHKLSNKACDTNLNVIELKGIKKKETSFLEV